METYKGPPWQTLTTSSTREQQPACTSFTQALQPVRRQDISNMQQLRQRQDQHWWGCRSMMESHCRLPQLFQTAGAGSWRVTIRQGLHLAAFQLHLGAWMSSQAA